MIVFRFAIQIVCGGQNTIPASLLWRSYEEHCTLHNEAPMSRACAGTLLATKFPNTSTVRRRVDGKPTKMYKGIQWRDATQQDRASVKLNVGAVINLAPDAVNNNNNMHMPTFT
jgi:hypothetical protein